MDEALSNTISLSARLIEFLHCEIKQLLSRVLHTTNQCNVIPLSTFVIKSNAVINVVGDDDIFVSTMLIEFSKSFVRKRR